ncbi:acylamino-acid-releasing enzyme-like isoform X2 [Denticeps clupeoides]|uniref:acylamino-acid-releasing enzyme-like isoform X2 n=1 Tax=Denticeps clupeoides TaxID=299321 RepID=UPI0010A345BA|nr:acylamino-acid-releasing enzyme-like isoform X2 [Denticeps clupeoides]
MEDVERDAVTAVFAQCSGFPTPVSASVIHRTPAASRSRYISITADWSQAEQSRAARLRFTQHWTLLCDQRTLVQSLPAAPCTHTQGELLSRDSPSGSRRAVIRATCRQQFLEVWGSCGLEKSLDLTALNRHGVVYEDVFASLAWSPCERRLLYVAEKSLAVDPPAVPVSPSNEHGQASLHRDEEYGEKVKSEYVEDWGEGFTGMSAPVLFVADLAKGEVSMVKGVPSHVSPAQALWAPDGGVVFVGWWKEPFRLGLKFCSNRRSALFHLDLRGNCEPLTADNVSVSSPRLSPDGRWLIYTQGRVFGPHNQCRSLHQYEWETRRTSVLLDVVKRSQKGEFAGLYESLPLCCWSSDSQRIIFSSDYQNQKGIFVLDRRTKQVRIISDDSEFSCWKLLLVHEDLLVVCCSSPQQPPCLRVGLLPPAGGEVAVSWLTLNDLSLTFEFEWKDMEISPAPDEENPEFSGLNFGAVLVKPRGLHSGRKLPLVVFIHGGPHSQFCAEWNASVAAFCRLGFAVLMVNFRGSTGFGQDSILSLIGNIGCQDVKDVHRAVLCALQSDTSLDPNRVVVTGGSHGGFLSCHLLGQYPDFYRACAARNPVINAATLLSTSDIVDWRYTSVGLEYSFDRLPTPEALTSMLQRSPITRVAQMQAPVLLMLGAKDRRVSPHQGLELYRALKSRGTTVRLLWYAEDGHSLSRVDTQADCFLNMFMWFQRALQMHSLS